MIGSKHQVETRTDIRSWRGTAFIVEALVLLVFVAGSLAVMMNVFADAYTTGQRSQNEARAIALASNAAEAFAAAPAEGVFVDYQDNFALCCIVNAEDTQAGTLYRANIAVYDLDDHTHQQVAGKQVADIDLSQLDPLHAVYQLQTARYVGRGVS